MSAEVATAGADSFGANGSNAGKKAVHVKVCFILLAIDLLCVRIMLNEIEIYSGHHMCFGICHDPWS